MALQERPEAASKLPPSLEKSSLLRVSRETHASLKEYSLVTGTPMGTVLDLVVRDWMRTIGAVRMETRLGIAEVAPEKQH